MDCEHCRHQYSLLLTEHWLDVPEGESEELFKHLDTCPACIEWFNSIEPFEQAKTDRICPGINSMLACMDVRMCILAWSNAKTIQQTHAEHVASCERCQSVVINAEIEFRLKPSESWLSRIQAIARHAPSVPEQKRGDLLQVPEAHLGASVLS